MNRLWAPVLGAVALVSVPLSSPVTAGTGHVDGTVASPTTVEVSGRTSVELPDGLVHLHADTLEPDTVRLEAREIQLHYTWIRAYDASSEDHDATSRQTTDYGEENRNLTRATMHLEPLEGRPELLVATPPDTGVQARARGTSTYTVVEDHQVTKAGETNASVRLGPHPRQEFSYRVDGPWVSGSGADRAVLDGNFTLFVNNVTLEGQAGQASPWSHWTGRKVLSNPASGVREVERRVTTLEVTDGSLAIVRADQLDVMGPVASLDVEGNVSASSVSGRISTPESTLRYDGAALQVSGDGLARLRPLPADGSDQDALGVDDEGVTEAELEGRFEVHPTGAVPVESQTSDVSALFSASTWFSWLPWLLAALGLLVAGVLPRSRIEGWWARRKARRRREQESRWMAIGDHLFEVREYEMALSWYRRVADNYPRTPRAWNSVASCLEELHRFAEASEAYERTARLLDDDPQMLVSAATCAWRAEDRDRAADLAREAIRLDEALCRQRLSAPRFDELRERPELRSWFQSEAEGPGTSYV